MSEYQYYEFRAIDEPLTKRQMEELRALSTRAKITPTSFTNEYHWGGFRGNPRKMMEKYFDAFLYYANWGSHWLMLRLPRAVVDVKQARQYCAGEALSVSTTRSHVIFDFHAESEDADWGQIEASLEEMTPIREELIRGDLRALYLGWLAAAQSEPMEEDTIEPPLPPGLGRLSESLKALAGFLYVEQELLAVAAAPDTGKPAARPRPGELAKWIRGLKAAEKDALLLSVAQGKGTSVEQRLVSRFQQAHAKTHRPPTAARKATRRTVEAPRRTVDQLMAAWHQRSGRTRAEEDIGGQRG